MNARGLTSLYSWTLPAALVSALKQRNYSAPRFLGWFWKTEIYAATTELTARDYFVVLLVGAGLLAQASTGAIFLVDWARFGTAGAWPFGLALIFSAPFVWAHLLALTVCLWHGLHYIAHPKKLGRSLVCTALEWQVRRLRATHTFTVVAVAGSVGKTSTKLAIASLLGQSKRVRHQTGNYNDRVTVPLVFFGLDAPNILNVLAWVRIFLANDAAIKQDYPYDVVVVELGTDGPGFMQEFAYVQPDVSVLTAITPEHMEFFKTLDAVAAEELSVFDYSKHVIVNGDDVPGKYLAGRDFVEYSTVSPEAAYVAVAKANGLQAQSLVLDLQGHTVETTTQYLGVQGAKIALAAATVASELGVDRSGISAGLPLLVPFAGRMQLLPGVKKSTLIDDTYNASPVALTAALDVLYGAKTKQRIAILGSMNELGDYSAEAHKMVGAYCDAKKLDMLVTVGADAKKYLAPTAKKQGCTVHSFTNAYEAGDYVLSHLKTDAVVLAKGSQFGVYTEEALKPLLANSEDVNKLVRQAPSWLAKKDREFPGLRKEL